MVVFEMTLRLPKETYSDNSWMDKQHPDISVSSASAHTRPLHKNAVILGGEETRKEQEVVKNGTASRESTGRGDPIHCESSTWGRKPLRGAQIDPK